MAAARVNFHEKQKQLEAELACLEDEQGELAHARSRFDEEAAQLESRRSEPATYQEDLDAGRSDLEQRESMVR